MNFEPDILGDNEEKCNNFIIEFGNSKKMFFFYSQYLLCFSSNRDRQSAGTCETTERSHRSNAMMRWKDGKISIKKRCIESIHHFRSCECQYSLSHCVEEWNVCNVRVNALFGVPFFVLNATLFRVKFNLLNHISFFKSNNQHKHNHKITKNNHILNILPKKSHVRITHCKPKERMAKMCNRSDGFRVLNRRRRRKKNEQNYFGLQITYVDNVRSTHITIRCCT